MDSVVGNVSVSREAEYEALSKLYCNKPVQFFPNDTVRKYGYIKRVDSLGYTYVVETTIPETPADEGEFFRNHALPFSFKVTGESVVKR